MISNASWRVAVGVALAVGVATAPAAAQDAPPTEPSAADKATARALMDEGDAMVAKGDFAGALRKYAPADEIMHVPSTGLALAQTQARLGLLVEAADTALRVQRFPARHGEPEAFATARSQAAALIDDVHARIPTATLALSGGDPSTVTRVTLDGRELPAHLRFLPRKINPGNHQAVVDAPGARGETAFTIAERETRTFPIALEPTTDAHAATPPPLPVPVPVPVRVPSRAPDALAAPINPGVWIGLGFAGAGLVAGAVTGGLTLAKNAKLRDACPDKQCASDDSQAELDASYRLANASTACFVVAGAGGVVALTAWLVTRNPEKLKKLGIEPVLAPTFWGVRGAFQ